MESEVYFTSVRARSDKENKISKVQKLFDAAGMAEVAGKGDLAAVKVHFGELGTDAYINPVLVRQVVDKLKSSGSMPFVTDTNTLYGGGRSNSADHVVTAILHNTVSSVQSSANSIPGINFFNLTSQLIAVFGGWAYGKRSLFHKCPG